MVGTALAILLFAAPPALEVQGDLPRTGQLTVKDLQALKPVKVKWGDSEITGVPVTAILAHFGWDEGPAGKTVGPIEKHAGLRAVVIATAGDGYQAVFSLGELSPELGNAQVLVVWEVDGKPLAAEHGTFRIVATSDKKKSRSTYLLYRLELRKLKP